mgnify:CR=1 FL=1
MRVGRIHESVAITSTRLQQWPIEHPQLASGDFDQTFLAQFAGRQCDRFAAYAQNVCDFLVGDLETLPFGFVQRVHDPAHNLLFVAVLAAAHSGHGNLQNHLPCGGHPDFQKCAVLRQFGLEDGQGQLVGKTRKFDPRTAEILIAAHDTAAHHALFAHPGDVCTGTVGDVNLQGDDGGYGKVGELDQLLGSEDQLSRFQAAQLQMG